MRYRLLGNSGLRVSDASLGTMTFGEDWGWGTAKDESRRVYDAFREAGGNFIDTANVYTNGSSDDFIAYRNRVCRVVNLCLAIVGVGRVELDKIAIAAVFQTSGSGRTIRSTI